MDDCAIEVSTTCCIPPSTSPSVDVCEGKVTSMKLEYVNAECSETTNDQGGKTKCSGGAPGDPTDVVITKSADKASLSPDTGIAAGSVFTVTATGSELKASTKFKLTGPDVSA